MSTDEDAAIETLAETVGIEPSYRGTDGRVQHVSAETKRAALLSMGFDLASASAVRAALHQREVADWRCLVAPVAVLRRSPGTTPSVAVTLPEALLARPMDWCVAPEAGPRLAGTLLPESLDRIEQRRVDGSSFVRLRLPLPADLADGYHRLTVAIAGSEAATTLISTPAAAFVPDWLERGERRWGIACPLFSLWSDASWGIGDFSDLAAFARLVRDLGASMVGLNPLHAPLPGERSDPNPYLPSTRIFLNPAHIDVGRIPTPLDPRFASRIAQAQSAKLVDYPLVYRLKREALEQAFRSRQWDGPQAFRQQHGATLARFAIFNALQERFGALPWHQWPAEFRTPVAAGIADFAQQHSDRIDYHVWAQWIADRQLADAAAELATQKREGGLYRDLAIGVGRDGADAWAEPDTYLTGASIGAPPDAFNPAGQDWGTPPPNPVTLRTNAYAPFIAALRANMRHAQVLRIDHVMGLQRLYWVPSGFSAGSGVYVRYPVDDLLGILALESHRNRCMIVGEDLGTLPEGFHERMAGMNIMSYRLLMFERYASGLFRRPSTYPRLAVATFGTHDLPTIRSWWEAQDIEIRRTLGLGLAADAGQEEQHRQDDRALLLAALRDQQLIGDAFDLDTLVVAIERFLARSPSALMMANLSDMLAEAVQINVPGTVAEHPNWRHRLRLPVSALASVPLVRRVAAAVVAERGENVAPCR